jgi:hypothetical protein
MPTDLRKPKQGRIIRRYAKNIPAEDFEKWQNLIRGRAKGRGLYALYDKKRLIYVGLATKSIRSRLLSHLREKEIPFTHFSVFLVAGSSPLVQGRRIRDIEALLLNIVKPRPECNKVKTNFVAAKRLKLE